MFGLGKACDYVVVTSCFVWFVQFDTSPAYAHQQKVVYEAKTHLTNAQLLSIVNTRPICLSWCAT